MLIAREECPMDRLDAIQIFVRVVESGSFSTVARERGVGPHE
jgi:DNA-binding transcriptional LysR family regulator